MRLLLSLFTMAAALLIVSDVPAQNPQQGDRQQGAGKKGKFGGQQGGGAEGGIQNQGMQAPGMQGGGRQGGKGMMGGGTDAMFIFESMAKGRPYFLISDARNLRASLTAFAKEQGITNDQITREQFSTFFPKAGQYMMPGGGRPGGPQGDGPTPPPGSPPIQPGQNPLEAIAAWAEADFKRRDINGDGRLVPEEMSEQLRSQLDRWDTNHDGLITLDEYKVYFSARLQMGDGGQNQPNPITILIEEDYDRRPDVIRAGKLPKELPKWFGELDVDQDGQVALHEWFKAGKDLEEFKEWDRNDDGLITAEEVLFRMKSNGTLSASNGRSPGESRGQGQWDGVRGGDSSGDPRSEGKGNGGSMADFFSKKKKGG